MLYISEGDYISAVFTHMQEDNPNREIEARVVRVEQRCVFYNEGRDKGSPLVHVVNVMNSKGQILSGPMHRCFDNSFITEIIKHGDSKLHKCYNIYSIPKAENNFLWHDQKTYRSKNQVTGSFQGLLCAFFGKLSRNINRELDIKRAWKTWQKDCYRGLVGIPCRLHNEDLVGSIFTVNTKTFKKWVFKNVDRILERSKDIEKRMTEYNNQCERDYWKEVDKEYAAEQMEEAGVSNTIQKDFDDYDFSAI